MQTTKRVLFVLGLFFGLISLTATTCNKENNPPDDNCTGYVEATVTGYIDQSFCFVDNPQYTYSEENQMLNFSANVTVDGKTYSIDVSVNPYTGPQSYSCGMDNAGYVELVVHGDENEFYKAQSGTLEITQADASHLTATFNVSAKGYYNEQTVSLSGSVLKVQ